MTYLPPRNNRYLGQSVTSEDKKQTGVSDVPPVEDDRVAAIRKRLKSLNKNTKSPGGMG